jgi:integrase
MSSSVDRNLPNDAAKQVSLFQRRPLRGGREKENFFIETEIGGDRLLKGVERMDIQEEIQNELLRYYKTFKRVYMDPGLRHSTAENYGNQFRLYILPRLGGLRLDEIERTHVEKLIAWMTQEGFAKDSIRLVLAVLSALFGHAKENKLVLDNPASRMGRHYRQAAKVREEIQPLTSEEVPAFLQAVMALCPQHYCLFLCAIHTGMRSGELSAVQWGDVDFKGKFFIVPRSISQRRRISATKTNRIRRVDYLG